MSSATSTPPTQREPLALAAARHYVSRGWCVIPVPGREKNPGTRGWENLRLAADELPRHFGETTNIGVHTGAASGGLVDVDCDVPEAVALAANLLPATGRIHGRPGNPRSHWWYIAPDARYEKFALPLRDANGRRAGETCLVELRGDGHQTIVPPSRHPGGDTYAWHARGDPAQVDAEALRVAVARIAAGAAIARAWPGAGSRDDAALALTGMLLRAGWPVADVDRFVVAVAEVAGDEEARARGKARRTRADLDAGRQVYGAPKLAELLTDGATVVECVRRWLGIVAIMGIMAPPVSSRDAEPRPLPLNVAAFPLDTLPADVGAFVRTVAAAVGCPIDYVAMPLLAYAGASIGNSAYLEIKRGYREYARLWVAVVGEPGDRKTPAIGATHALIEERQRALASAWRDTGGERADPPTPMPQLYTSDATIEALGDLLRDNPRGVIVSRDELSGWALAMNEYKKRGADRQHWLQLWSGWPLLANRRSRGRAPLYVERPFVSVVGGIQPDVLGELCDERGRNDGFVHRLLFVYPDRLRQRTWTDAEIADEAYAPMRAMFDQLYITGSPEAPLPVTFTSAARDLWREIANTLYAEADAPDFPDALRGPWAKLEAHIARLALILHFMRAALDPAHVAAARCDVDSLGGAADLAEYLKSHLRRVYARLTARPEDVRLLRVMDWIRQHGNMCTTRALYDARVAGIHTSAEAEAISEQISERGWGRADTITNRRGRPTIRITLHDSAISNMGGGEK